MRIPLTSHTVRRTRAGACRTGPITPVIRTVPCVRVRGEATHTATGLGREACHLCVQLAAHARVGPRTVACLTTGITAHTVPCVSRCIVPLVTKAGGNWRRR
jgi:hypothetical protein